MDIKQAKNIYIVDLLACLNYYPQKKVSNDSWYLSPLRKEKTPSFKVNVKENIWFDHGEGCGGNIIDLVMKLKNTDVRGVLRFLESTLAISTARTDQVSPALGNKKRPDGQVPEITEIKPLSSYVLKNYLKDERGIPLELGNKFLKEIHFKLGIEEYYALGFQNRSKGWELRNKYYKGGIGRKDITVFEAGTDKVHVFEGFSDFLSGVYLSKDILKHSIIILNSITMKNEAIKFIKDKKFFEVFTYFDNDNAGKKTTEYFKTQIFQLKTMNYLYQAFNDLNDMVTKRQLTSK